MQQTRSAAPIYCTLQDRVGGRYSLGVRITRSTFCAAGRVSVVVAGMMIFEYSLTAKSLLIREFTTENGLPHNRVNRIYRDSRNFMWICTDDGLARFDGHQFVNYTTANGLPHMHINAILETRGGEYYWIATDAGLSRFDPAPDHTRFRNYTLSANANAVNALLEERDGTLLVGTNAGLFRFGASHAAPQFEPIRYAQLNADAGALKVNTMAYDAKGRLWLGTEVGLYSRGADGSWRHPVGAGRYGEPMVFFLQPGNDGHLWVGFRGGFGRLGLNPLSSASALDRTWTQEDRVPFRDARSMVFGTGNRSWIATDRGLVEWLAEIPTRSTFRAYAVEEKLKVEQTNGLAEDAAGNLWLGTRRSGLLCIRQARFQTYGMPQGLRLNSDQTLVATHGGNMCVFDLGDARRSLYCEANGQFSQARTALPQLITSEAPHWLEMAHLDSRGAWWFSSRAGLFRLPSLNQPSDLRLGTHVTRFFEDSKGDLWIAASFQDLPGDRALLHWERRSGKLINETHRLPLDVKISGVGSFAEDANGDLWLGLERPGGLLRRKEGRYYRIPGPPHGHINQLFADSRHRLWIASTEDGLSVIDDPSAPTIRNYRRDGIIPTSEVWCITEDLQGRIYAGSSRGVDRLNAEGGGVVHYSAADGLTSGDIRSAVRDRNGALWFASANGVSRFMPEWADTLALLPRTRITAIRIAGAPVAISEFGGTEFGPLTVSSKENSLEVDFASSDYQSVADVPHEFRLHPDRPWQSTNLGRIIRLNDLSPSSYDLQVRSRMPGSGSGNVCHVRFDVVRPTWQQWWFQLICVSFAAAGTWALHLNRVNKRLALERIRTQIAADLHDDIGASLSRIYILGEAMRARLGDARSGGEEMLNEIVGSSQRLIGEMDDIVWSMNPRRDSFADFISRLRAFGSDILERHGVEWLVETPEMMEYQMPPDVRRQLYLLFKEGIHNIRKYSRAHRASLSFRLEKGLLLGELSDDGSGMTPDAKNGNGLSSMHARAERIGGRLKITTEPGSGTRLRLSIPFKPTKTHKHALFTKPRVW